MIGGKKKKRIVVFPHSSWFLGPRWPIAYQSTSRELLYIPVWGINICCRLPFADQTVVYSQGFILELCIIQTKYSTITRKRGKSLQYSTVLGIPPWPNPKIVMRSAIRLSVLHHNWDSIGIYAVLKLSNSDKTQTLNLAQAGQEKPGLVPVQLMLLACFES